MRVPALLVLAAAALAGAPVQAFQARVFPALAQGSLAAAGRTVSGHCRPPPRAAPHLAGLAMSEAARSPAAAAGFVRDRAVGLALAGSIGFAGECLAKSVSVSLSPLLYATAIGIAIGNVLRIFDPSLTRLAPAAAGMTFAKKRLLRAGIILYGAKITFAKILGIGLPGLLADLYVVTSTLALGFALGHILGLSKALTTLISTGSAICGCSAVAATQPIINAEAHEVAAAIGVVVLCGTSAMFLYPALFKAVPALAADPRLMGIYTGSTVHELAGTCAQSLSVSSLRPHAPVSATLSLCR